jgi:hypothetical protein
MSNFKPFNWKCPHCNREAVVGEHSYESGGAGFSHQSADGQVYLSWQRIVCPSPSCEKFEFIATLSTATPKPSNYGTRWIANDLIGRGKVRFMPPSTAEAFPDYVPLSIRQDYEEACLIVDLSPKAAATLARRALQGIVRDYWGGKGRTLKDEIDSVKDKCDPLTWDAMTAVREVGNIGAHMEKDIDLIIDVDADEAQLLIALIETLVRETYFTRYARTQQMQGLKELAEDKKRLKQPLAIAKPASDSGQS